MDEIAVVNIRGVGILLENFFSLQTKKPSMSSLCG